MTTVSYFAGENLVPEKERIDSTPIDLLMEGDCTLLRRRGLEPNGDSMPTYMKVRERDILDTD